MIDDKNAERNDTSVTEVRGPTQLEIAAHLDMSERNVREMLQKVNIDHRQSTLEEIRVKYIRYLRELAAGRGGTDQFDLTKQKTRQAETDANLKELEYFTKTAQLVPIDEIEPLLSYWAVGAKSEVENCVDRILVAIESKHGIDIERDFIDAEMAAAFDAIAAYPTGANDNDAAGGDKMEATA